MRTVLLTSLLLISSLCAAQTAGVDSEVVANKKQHFNFTQQLLGVGGKPIHIGDEKSDVMTLGDVAVTALESMLEEDRNADGKVKFERDQLSRKIYKQKDVVLSVEEITLIKERIGRVYSPAVVGAAWPLLDASVQKSK